jgi:hypothetical protein
MTTAGEGSLSSYLDYTSDAGMQGAATEMRRQRVRVRSLLIVHRATVSNVTRRTIYNHADLLDRNRGQRGGHRFRPVPEQAPSLIGRGRRGLEKNGAHAPGVFRGYSEHTLGV